MANEKKSMILQTNILCLCGWLHKFGTHSPSFLFMTSYGLELQARLSQAITYRLILKAQSLISHTHACLIDFNDPGALLVLVSNQFSHSYSHFLPPPISPLLFNPSPPSFVCFSPFPLLILALIISHSLFSVVLSWWQLIKCWLVPPSLSLSISLSHFSFLLFVSFSFLHLFFLHLIVFSSARHLYLLQMKSLSICLVLLEITSCAPHRLMVNYIS